jgi:endonuclease/exonuclease/phosphatase family metal-dependent hydrolase
MMMPMDRSISIRGLTISTLVVALVSLSTCATLRTPRPAVGARLAVLTYNINWGQPDQTEALAAIRDADADIVCLQETTPRWERFLVPRLRELYPHQRFRHSPGAGGQAILSKRPFRDVEWSTPGAGWFPFWVVEAQTEMGDVQIAGVHLRPPLGENGGLSVGAYLRSGSTHRREVEELMSHIDPARPLIIAGDFNEEDSGTAIEWLDERGLTDALPLFDRSTDTWRWPTSVLTLTGRYDHVVFSRHFDCVRAEVIERGESDHLPVLAVLELSSGR